MAFISDYLIILSGIVCGIILFQTAVIAPTVFKVLEGESAGAFLRTVFPRFFLIIMGLGVLMFVLAILMISSIRFPKATRRENNFINVFQVIAILGIYYCGITRTYPEYLFGMGLFLMIVGIISGRITRYR